MKKNGDKLGKPAPMAAASEGSMPMPSSATAEFNAGESEMPVPGMLSAAAATDEMPKPANRGGASRSGGMMPEPSASARGEMPMPSFSGDGLGLDAGRFAPPDAGSSREIVASYEPGVVEVEFVEGVAPTVVAPDASEGAAIQSAAAVPLDEVNRVLQRFQLVRAEPTFLTSAAESETARATAQAQGIDVPLLSNFVTLHFANDADVEEIAAELSQLAEVERAVPVPIAIPPASTPSEPIAALKSASRRASGPPKVNIRKLVAAAAEAELTTPEVAPQPADELAPAGPLSEPLVGTGDQVVLNPVTGLENQWYIFRCRINGGWTGATGQNVVIADIDWGYRTSHQDLAAKIERTYNSFDGTTDVTHGGSVSHGTAVMGLTGAIVSGVGMAGVAFEAALWPIQADSGTSPGLGGNAWARGIDWVRTTSSGGRRKIIILEVQTGAFGNYEQVPSVNAAIRTAIAAGVVVCVAAGNGNRDAGISDTGAAIQETGSILVGATSYDPAQNRRASFSNFGPRIVVSAPGDPSHDLTCNSTSDTAYRNGFGGTSGATPKVAGVAALMLAANPQLTHAEVRSILRATGTAVVTEAAKPVGTFLNAAGALQQATAGGVGRLEIFARGSDNAIWHKWQTAPNNGWSGWASFGGWVDRISSARNADGRLEVFARGSDRAVWHKWQTAPNNGWSAWASLGGWVDAIDLARNADGRLELFARGADGVLWHKWQTAPNNGWSAWASLGGWIDRLATAQNADGRIEVFARGGDGAVWHKWQTAPNNGWSAWASLGGWVDMIQVGRNADGRLELFARGADGAVWHKWQTAPNNGWSAWASLGGWIDLLSVGRNADGRLEIFARGADRAVWHKWQTAPNNGWSGWASLGGWIDRLTVKNNADGRLELFVRGSDKAVWHKWQTAPNNGWSGWASLGGWIDILNVDQNAA